MYKYIYQKKVSTKNPTKHNEYVEANTKTQY